MAPQYRHRMGREAMTSLYLQLDVYLDYDTGMHEPSLSAAMKAIFDKGGSGITEYNACIPEKHWSLFPQLGVEGTWPPTILIHGDADTADVYLYFIGK